MDDFAALSLVNDGVFSRGQALDAGWADRDLLAARRARVIVRLRRGWYCEAPTYDALDQPGQHLLLARAVVLSQLGTVALTGPTAAVLHGLGAHALDLGAVHLVRLDRGSPRRQVGVKHQVLRHDIEKDLETVNGLLTVNVARTVWEVATVSSFEASVCVADTALRLRPDVAGDVATIAGTFSRRPGSHRARQAIELADGRSANPGESISRVLFHQAGLPAPELQQPLHDQDGQLVGIVDFLWDEWRHVGEFDGRAKYTDYLRPDETPADVVFREKRREDRIRATGRGMTRWVWSDLMPDNRRSFVRRLSEDLARSRQLYGARRRA